MFFSTKIILLKGKSSFEIHKAKKGQNTLGSIIRSKPNSPKRKAHRTRPTLTYTESTHWISALHVCHPTDRGDTCLVAPFNSTASTLRETTDGNGNRRRFIANHQKRDHSTTTTASVFLTVASPSGELHRLSRSHPWLATP